MSGFNLLNNNPDGAKWQAQAILAMVRDALGDSIEASWEADTNPYLKAEPKVTRYDNGREQGYVIFLKDINYDKQINIAFAEHRSSDGITVVITPTVTFNAPQLGDITDPMDDGTATDRYFNYGRIVEAADFIAEQLKAFWEANPQKTREPRRSARLAKIDIDAPMVSS